MGTSRNEDFSLKKKKRLQFGDNFRCLTKHEVILNYSGDSKDLEKCLYSQNIQKVGSLGCRDR